MLLEGGNVIAKMTKYDKIETPAEKVDLKLLSVDNFRKLISSLFIELNNLYKQKFKVDLWVNPERLKTSVFFNGSTSYIMDDNIKASEVLKYKKSAGDVDIMVDSVHYENLFKLLISLEGKKIAKYFRYMGSNRFDVSKLGDQINSVFILRYDNNSYAVQIDFEKAIFIKGTPHPFAKFSHSSSFEDAKTKVEYKGLDNSKISSYIKGGVLHKYLLRAICHTTSYRDDIVIATPSSTPEKLKISKSAQSLDTRVKSFSVDYGLRFRLEPFLDNDGNHMMYNGKYVYRYIDTKNSRYEIDLETIFTSLFGENNKEIDLMFSYVGLVKLCNKYLNNNILKKVQQRLFELLWEIGAQQLERNKPKLDYEIKMAGYTYFCKELKLTALNNEDEQIKNYYKNYRVEDESFLNFINNL